MWALSGSIYPLSSFSICTCKCKSDLLYSALLTIAQLPSVNEYYLIIGGSLAQRLPCWISSRWKISKKTLEFDTIPFRYKKIVSVHKWRKTHSLIGIKLFVLACPDSAGIAQVIWLTRECRCIMAVTPLDILLECI